MRFPSVPVLSVLLAGLAPGASEAQIKPRPMTRDSATPQLRGERDGVRIDRPVGEAPVARPDGTVTTVSFEDLLEVARQSGLEQAEISEATDKQKSIFGYYNNLLIEYSPYACENDRCRAMTFYAYFGKQDDAGPKFVNSFNTVKVATLYTQPGDEQLMLRYNLMLEGGVTREHVAATGRFFTKAIQEALDFKPDG